MKVLFDSNIHVSDAIFGGAATRAIKATLQARWKILVCQTILVEVHRVIREKFKRSGSFASATIAMIREISEIADEPMSRHKVEGDASDSPILRAAIGAGIDYLITGDLKILALKVVEGVQIITLGEYIRVLEQYGHLGV